jgi:hypothetical protein
MPNYYFSPLKFELLKIKEYALIINYSIYLAFVL